jgi:uncharacterized membrane protein
MAHVEQSIEVNVPVKVAYDQWTQFESFPQFMEGVKSVTQQDDTHVAWTAEVGGEERSWTAEITRQEPDRVIAWRSVEGKQNDGRVTFDPISSDTSRVNAEFDLDTEGFKEKVGDALGFIDRRVKGDLERFKELVEKGGAATGAWRGDVREGSATERR